MVQVDTFTNVRKVLTDGGIILYPTDTIWGIGCDACNAHAVEKIFELKKRDRSKPFILLADSVQMIQEYVAEVHPRLDTLLSFHVRPLTVIYEGARNLPPNLIAADGSIGFRIPQDNFCKALIKSFGKPLVATSANISNEPFPTNFGTISSEVIQGVDYVVKTHSEAHMDSNPSVIVKISAKGELDFIRK